MKNSVGKTGYIVFGHGSSVESANEAVRVVARKFASELAAREGDANVAPAFLELGKPDLNGAVGQLAQAGVEHAVILPYFLTLGLHLQRDLPKLAEGARAAHPGIEITVAPPLDGHPAMVEALLGRAGEAAEKLEKGVRAGKTG